MAYIDGCLMPVLPGRRDDYVKMAHEAARIFLDYGAIEVVDSLSDDVPEGKLTDLWRAVQADKAGGESLALSWIIWPSKEARNAGWGKAMADERMKPSPDDPFDGKRMVFGGFERIPGPDAA